jgi:HlyD family secretion protein
MTSGRWIAVVTCGMTFAGIAAWALRPAATVQVERAQVTTGPIVRQVIAVGTVEARTMVEVGSQVSGTVQAVEADYDSIVHAGQVVARLDPSSYDAQVQQARGALAQTQADVLGARTAADEAHAGLARAEELAARQLITPEDLDDARTAMDEASADLHAAEATVVAARAAVDEATADRDHTIIRSPVDGVVIDRDVEVGQTLAAGMQAPVLFTIASDLTTVQVQADIDESDVAGLTTGEPAAFTVESYADEPFHGTLTQLLLQPVAEQTTAATPVLGSTDHPASTAVPTVVGYTAIIDVPNQDERLRPGMTAEVVLDGVRRDTAVRIPNGALAFRPTAAVLTTLGESGVSPSHEEPDQSAGDVWKYDGKRLTEIAVRVGLADDGWTELLSGPIRPGDALVTSAQLQR